MVFDGLALVSAVLWALGGLFLAFGWMRSQGVRKLREAVVQPVAEWPSVTVIVPARDECESIRETVTRLAESTYPKLKIIVVNDRSRDGTGDIARDLTTSNPNLTVVDIEALPELWLGKTHAMQAGYERSHGDWLCFVDADVKVSRDCIRRAMAVVLEGKLDHLALFPSMETHGIGEGAFVVAFALFFGACFQPWKAKNPNSSRFCGVGAFNLIRRTAYEGVGTHEALRLEIADDMKLGKLIKRHGFRQDVFDGDGHLSVRWQSGGLSGYVRGLEKNAFAGLNYSLFRVVLATAGIFLISVVPFLGLLLTDGYGRWASGMSVSLLALAYVPITHQMRTSWLYFMVHPLAAILLAWSIWRSTFKALTTGHVSWRGTDYPLSLLRRYMI
jgi:glycosyltransferase involved in cell wall biosynthesis